GRRSDADVGLQRADAAGPAVAVRFPRLVRGRVGALAAPPALTTPSDPLLGHAYRRRRSTDHGGTPLYFVIPRPPSGDRRRARFAGALLLEVLNGVRRGVFALVDLIAVLVAGGVIGLVAGLLDGVVDLVFVPGHHVLGLVGHAAHRIADPHVDPVL